MHVGGLSLELLQQQRSEHALDAAIGAVARRALPGDPGTGAVRSRIEQRLLAAQGNAGGCRVACRRWRRWRRRSAGVNGASVQALSYREGGLDLKLKASDAESLERIDQALRSDGWQAELTSGGAAAAGYEGRIQMRPRRRREREAQPMMDALPQYSAAAQRARAAHRCCSARSLRCCC